MIEHKDTPNDIFQKAHLDHSRRPRARPPNTIVHNVSIFNHQSDYKFFMRL